MYYQDGSVLAHLAPPDMRVPIAHALAYPERIEIEHRVLDLVQYGALTFSSPDYERFPMLKLAQESLKGGISARVCFNAANEVMVERFLRGECSFLDIQNRVADMMMKHNNIDLKTIDDIILHHEYLQISKN